MLYVDSLPCEKGIKKQMHMQKTQPFLMHQLSFSPLQVIHSLGI